MKRSARDMAYAQRQIDASRRELKEARTRINATKGEIAILETLLALKEIVAADGGAEEMGFRLIEELPEETIRVLVTEKWAGIRDHGGGKLELVMTDAGHANLVDRIGPTKSDAVDGKRRVDATRRLDA